jgi:glutamate-1-semialdehyde aminotransferase
VLFMIDEVITALRWGARGLNGTGGVAADVITISKGMANGHALGAVLGPRDVIGCYDQAGIAGTYNREVPPMAAALAVLDVIEDGAVHEHCEKMGGLLKDGMREILADVGIPAYVTGPNMMFDVVVGSDLLSWDIYRAAYDYGAYFEDSGTQMVTAAFGETEVKHALSAFEQGARRVAATTSHELGELGEDRRRQFAADAFGGALTDTDEVLKQIEQTVADIADRAARPGAPLPPACG